MPSHATLRLLFRWTVVAVVWGGLLWSAPVAAQADVLIIAAETGSWADEVRQTLQDTGILRGSIDVFDAAAASPTLDLLNQYDAVLVYSNTSFRNSNQLGTRLAQYVELGGGVVQAGLAFSSGGGGLGGRWGAQDYGVWEDGAIQSGSRLTLGNVLAPDHPIMNGVDSLDGGSGSWHNRVGALTPGSQLIAQWSNGQGLAAANTTRNGVVVGLNLFPPSDLSRADFWVNSTAGGILIANALGFAGAPTTVPEPSGLVFLSVLAAGGWAARRIRRRRCGRGVPHDGA